MSRKNRLSEPDFCLSETVFCLTESDIVSVSGKIRLSETVNCLTEAGTESEFCLSEAQNTSQRTPQ